MSYTSRRTDTAQADACQMIPPVKRWGHGPEGALIPDVEEHEDHIAVIYDKGEAPPEITITTVSRTVQTVLANGVAVAVVARATGPALTVDDILLVERFVSTRS